MKVRYCKENPIISPNDIILEDKTLKVVGTFNPGVTKYNDETILLVRVAIKKEESSDKAIACIWKDGINTDLQFVKNDDIDLSDCRLIKTKNRCYLSSISIFSIFRSKDGEHFNFDKFIYPDGPYEEYGIEDPRISKIDDTYYITYSAVSSNGICGRLMTTTDFNTFKRMGNIFGPDDKDIAYFGEKINEKYYLIHRPCLSDFSKPEIWICESDNLLYFGNHRILLKVRENSWDSSRIGVCSEPIKTADGWLMIYHGADENNSYSIGACLLDLNDPSIVLKRSKNPILKSTNDYEINGFFNNVVFPCGLTKEDDTLSLYYGAADKYVALAKFSIKEIIESLE